MPNDSEQEGCPAALSEPPACDLPRTPGGAVLRQPDDSHSEAYVQYNRLNGRSQFHFLRVRFLLIERSIKASSTDRSQGAHPFHTQLALHWHHFPDLVVDAVAPVVSLFRRRAPTFSSAASLSSNFCSEIDSGDVNIHSGQGLFYSPFGPGVDIHISPESVFTSHIETFIHMPRNPHCAALLLVYGSSALVRPRLNQNLRADHRD